ncbi:MAG TPA: phosphatase PAP2 family protein [Thermomicrobiales bacterium]|nr:phosphatase PAP2 family protein [Thermomicrobiales bacterium]
MSTSLSQMPSRRVPSHSAHPQGDSQSRFQVLRTVREVGIVSLAVFLYFFVRGLMDSSASLAESHAYRLVDIERWLGIFREPQVQDWVLRHDWLVWTVNAVYMYGHWPVLIATMIWLVWKRPAQFPIYRSALLISGAIGLVVFVTFPMAPPRFLPDLGFVDTVTLHTNAYRVLQPPAFTNQYASMPSLHVGWNLLMGIAIFRTTGNRIWRTFAVLMPLAMYLATILTANHFFLDGIIGSIVAITGLAIAMRISGPTLRPTTSAPVLIETRREHLEAA